MELITEKEIGRLKHFYSHGGFGIPKHTGEIIAIRFEKKENISNDHTWKLPGDTNCNIWMMDSIGEFIDCVLEPDNPALDGSVTITSDIYNYFPRVKIDLNAVQASGTGIVIVTLTTKTTPIYNVIKDLTVNLDVINPSKYRNKNTINLTEKEEEIWNILSFSPTEDKNIYDIDEDWNNISIMMFFIYDNRWNVKPLSHMFSANNLNEKIKDNKNLCYALNNIILKNYALPEGFKSIRSLLLGNKNIYSKNNHNNINQNQIIDLSNSDEDDLDGPILIKHSNSSTDYKYLINKLKERKNQLKEFLLKNQEKIIKENLLKNNHHNLNYLNNNNNNNNNNNLTHQNSYDSFSNYIDSEFNNNKKCTLESNNQDIQILKQIVNELQLQLVDIINMFMSSTPPSFTIQGTGHEVTYKELLNEIQFMESTLLLHKQSLLNEKDHINHENIIFNQDILSSELKPVTSNFGYTQFIDKMEKLRESVELYGFRSRQIIIENKDLNNESKEYTFNKIKNIELRFDQLNSEFNDFLFNLSYSNLPRYNNNI